jgi:drug/metabolite transporter (DMT)-like permease
MLSMLIWAMGLPAASLLLGTVPPLPLTAARMVMAACCLLPLWLLLEGADALRKASWWQGIRVGGSPSGWVRFYWSLGRV